MMSRTARSPMRSPLRLVTIACLALFASMAVRARPQRAAAATAPDPATRIVAAAQAVLTALDEGGRTKVQFPFDGPQKTRWSNLPSPMFQREGLRLADLSPAQRSAVMSLLSAALSKPGYQKVTDIMRGDEVLRKNRSEERRVGKEL